MKGILFKAPMIDAIMAGKKTQTRRVMKPQPPAVFGGGLYGATRGTLYAFDDEGSDVPTTSYTLRPKYHVGETVYVKERYDPAIWPGWPFPVWKSPLFMPASAARTLLRITSVRVERTRDISWQDCIAEGVVQSPQWLKFIESGAYQPPENLRPGMLSPDEAEAELDRAWQEYVRQAYWVLYNSINGAGAHLRNWDWVYEFRRVPAPGPAGGTVKESLTVGGDNDQG